MSRAGTVDPGQDPVPPVAGPAARGPRGGERPGAVLSCASLAGERVLGIGGQELGRLQHVMIDVRAGRVAYGVLAAGGVFGLGARLYAVPWRAFEFDPAHLCLRLPADRERLERAPAFDRDRWPASASPEWVRQVHEHFAAPAKGP